MADVNNKAPEKKAERQETFQEAPKHKIVAESTDSNTSYDQGRRALAQEDKQRRGQEGAAPSKDTQKFGRPEISDGDKKLVHGHTGSDAKVPDAGDNIKMPAGVEQSHMSGTITSANAKETYTMRDGTLYDAAGKAYAKLDSQGNLHFEGKTPIEVTSQFSGWKFEGTENRHAREVIFLPRATNGSLTIPQDSGAPFKSKSGEPVKAEVRLGMVINPGTGEQIAILHSPMTDSGKLSGGEILFAGAKGPVPLCNVKGAVFDLKTVGEGSELGFQSRRMQGIAMGPQEYNLNGARKDVGGILDLQSARDTQKKMLEREREKGNESGVRNAQDSLDAIDAVVDSGRTNDNLTTRLQTEVKDADRELNPDKQYDPKQLERLPEDCSNLNGTAVIPSDKAPGGKMQIAVKDGQLMTADGKEAIGKINPDGSVTFKNGGSVSMRDLAGSSWNLTDGTNPQGPRHIKWLSMGNQGMYSISNAIVESHNEEVKYGVAHNKDYQSWTTRTSTVDEGFRQNRAKADEFRARMERLANGEGTPEDTQALVKGPKDYIEHQSERKKPEEKTPEKPVVELPRFDDAGAAKLADLKIRVGNDVYVTKPDAPGQLFRSKDGQVEDKPCGKPLGNYKIEVDGRTIELTGTSRVLMEFRTSQDDPKVHRIIGMGPGHVGEHGQQVRGGLMSHEQLASDAKFMKQQAERGNIDYFNKRPYLTGRLTNWIIGDPESSLKAASGQIDHQVTLMNQGFDTMFSKGFNQKDFANDRLDVGVNATRWAVEVSETHARDSKVIADEAKRYQQQINDAVVMVAIGAATAGVGLKAALLRGAAISAIGRQTEGGGLTDLAGNAVGGACEAGGMKLMGLHQGLTSAKLVGAVAGESVGAAAAQRISAGLRGQDGWQGAQMEIQKLGWGAMWNAIGMGVGTKWALSDQAQKEIGKVAQNSLLKGSLEHFIKNAPREAIQNFTTAGLEAMSQGVQLERQRIAQERGIPVEQVSDGMLAQNIRWGNVLGVMSDSGVMGAVTGIASTAATSRHGAIEARNNLSQHDVDGAAQHPDAPYAQPDNTSGDGGAGAAAAAAVQQGDASGNIQPRRLPVDFDPSHAARDAGGANANQDRIVPIAERQAKRERAGQHPDDSGTDGSASRPQQQKQLKAVGYYGGGGGGQDALPDRGTVRSSARRPPMSHEDSSGEKKQAVTANPSDDTPSSDVSKVDSSTNHPPDAVPDNQIVRSLKKGTGDADDATRQDSAELRPEDIFTPDELQQITHERDRQMSRTAVALTDADRADMINSLYSEAAAGKEKGERLDIVMGPAGAGKSAKLFEPLVEQHKAVPIDPDAVKKAIPGYEGGEGASAVHKESATIAKEVRNKALADGYNVVWATVGNNKNVLDQVIKQFEKAGYSIHVHFVDVPPEVAARRVFNRSFHSDQSKRQWVDPATASKTAAESRKVYQELLADKKIGAKVKSYEHWNNDVPMGQEPVLVSRTATPHAKVGT